jgi:Sel1 repeat
MCLENEIPVHSGNLIKFLKYADPNLENLLERATANDGDALFAGSLVLLGGFDLAPVDEVEAIEWARRGALARHPGCAIVYGLHIASGYGMRRRRDADQYIIMGKKWLLDATRDQNQPYALMIRALVEADGLGGFRPSKIHAARLFTEAAKLGNPFAQHQLGLHYEQESRQTGHGNDGDALAAFGFMKNAAEQGYAPAQRILSKYYTAGFGTERDLDRALEWLFKAANQHYPMAALEAGHWCSGQGERAEPDSEEAKKWLAEMLKWYHLAARNGLPGAEIAIAQCYEFGIGVEENKATAYSIYYALANRDGKTILTRHPNQQARHFIKNRMTMLRGNSTMVGVKGNQIFISWGEDEMIITKTSTHTPQQRQIRKETHKRRPN